MRVLVALLAAPLLKSHSVRRWMRLLRALEGAAALQMFVQAYNDTVNEPEVAAIALEFDTQVTSIVIL